MNQGQIISKPRETILIQQNKAHATKEWGCINCASVEAFPSHQFSCKQDTWNGDIISASILISPIVIDQIPRNINWNPYLQGLELVINIIWRTQWLAFILQIFVTSALTCHHITSGMSGCRRESLSVLVFSSILQYFIALQDERTEMHWWETLSVQLLW